MRFAKRKAFGVDRPIRSGGLHIGFSPTVDCAPVIVAQELGFFARQGLSVRLSREVGWATIREKLLHEELNAVASHASTAVSLYCGLEVIRRPCITGLFLSANCSAITVSTALWKQGAQDAASMAALIRREAPKKINFGVVLKYSSQHMALRKWLQSAGVDPDHDVNIVVVPSALVYDIFRQGFLDGYCVAEPWNSLAVVDGTGHVVATSDQVLGDHPEKAFLVLQDFAEDREEEHVRMIAALIEAMRFCADFKNRKELVRILAGPSYFDIDAAYLANALVGPFKAANPAVTGADFLSFDVEACGMPTRTRGRAVLDLVKALSPSPANQVLHKEVIPKIFRPDIYNKAIKLVHAEVTLPDTKTSDDQLFSHATLHPHLQFSSGN